MIAAICIQPTRISLLSSCRRIAWTTRSDGRRGKAGPRTASESRFRNTVTGTVLISAIPRGSLPGACRDRAGNFVLVRYILDSRSGNARDEPNTALECDVCLVAVGPQNGGTW